MGTALVTKKNSKKYLHALHNEKACKYLKKSTTTDFSDWVVTTAFYSAICFIDSYLFPGKYNNPLKNKIENFNNFDICFNSCKTVTDKQHQFRFKLVEEHFPEIKDDFKTLMDNSSNARYQNYIMPEGISNLAVSCLENIKEVCT